MGQPIAVRTNEVFTNMHGRPSIKDSVKQTSIPSVQTDDFALGIGEMAVVG